MEAAGILVPLGNLGASGELLDLSAPELSLGGVSPRLHLLPRDQHEWVLERADAQAPPSETTRQDTGDQRARLCRKRRGTG